MESPRTKGDAASFIFRDAGHQNVDRKSPKMIKKVDIKWEKSHDWYANKIFDDE